jgi:hypothetical protein
MRVRLRIMNRAAGFSAMQPRTRCAGFFRQTIVRV